MWRISSPPLGSWWRLCGTYCCFSVFCSNTRLTVGDGEDTAAVNPLSCDWLVIAPRPESRSPVFHAVSPSVQCRVQSACPEARRSTEMESGAGWVRKIYPFRGRWSAISAKRHEAVKANTSSAVSCTDRVGNSWFGVVWGKAAALLSCWALAAFNSRASTTKVRR